MTASGGIPHIEERSVAAVWTSQALPFRDKFMKVELQWLLKLEPTTSMFIT